MSDTPWAVKDPDEVKDYGLRWAASLADQNGGSPDVLASSIWIVAPDTLTVDSDSFEAGASITTIWVSGGVLGETYLCTNRVTTAGGRTYDWTKKLKIKSK